MDMWRTCNYVMHMTRMIQLRNVPDDLHARLKARAALEGKSLSDFLIEQVRAAAERPTVEEMRRRLARRTPVTTRPSPTSVLRRERDGR